MSAYDAALELAKIGFHVFPVLPGSKKSALKGFPVLASADPAQIKKWWMDPVLDLERAYNVGISTSRFNGGKEALLAVDVDNKNGKNGSQDLFDLEMQGFYFPPTFTQTTPTGGQHLIYRCPTAVRQGTGILAKGLDIRSKGGYVLGAGSKIDEKLYVWERGPRAPAPAPSWLIEKCGIAKLKKTIETPAYYPSAMDRAQLYLQDDAPLSIEGDGGNQTAYKVAARVKDYGVRVSDCLDLMMDHWNDRNEPPWGEDELFEIIQHAYVYGHEAAGSAAPETDFSPLEKAGDKLHPFKELNKEYAFVVAGGGSHILWETTGSKNEKKLEHLGVLAFHQKLAAQTMMGGDGKTRAISELWMKSRDRRSYDGICFMPGITSPPRFYNLWKGFSFEPADDKMVRTKEAVRSLDMFLDHAKTNVCKGDDNLFRWLMGYFAHIIQKPWEKPLVALVFRGKKGVGKNALIDCIGSLVSSHYLLTSNRRYLISNFNGHLQNLLLFALDEAFWSGDKQAEGILKDLITGKTHVIEHKGKEPYSVENCTRVVIIGNEDWLVPASQDERRYAVYDVGEGRKQDRSFFTSMREGMEGGGYRLLLKYLLHFDLRGIELNQAPQTSGLMDQKINSLDPFAQWWLGCITDGTIAGADFGGDWPREVEKERFRWAFRMYMRERNIRTRIPDDRVVGRLLATCLPSVDAHGKKRQDGERVNTYRFPPLDQARKEFEAFIGHVMRWE